MLKSGESPPAKWEISGTLEWIETEKFALKQKVRLKDKLNEFEESVASFHKLNPGVIYEINNMLAGYYRCNGSKRVLRNFIAVIDLSSHREMEYCPSYLFTNAQTE